MLYLMGGRCRRGRIEQERVGCSAGTGFDSCMNMVKRGEQSEGTDANTGLTYSEGDAGLLCFVSEINSRFMNVHVRWEEKIESDNSKNTETN